MPDTTLKTSSAVDTMSAADIDRELAGLDALELGGRERKPLPARIWSATWPKLIAIGLFLGVWQLVALSGWKSDHILPDPATVLRQFWTDLTDGTFFRSSLLPTTLKRALIGYAAAVAIGTAIGAVLSQVKVLRTGVGSLITGLQTMPSVLWFPLAIVLFGLSESAILFVVIIGAAPSIAKGIIVGIRPGAAAAAAGRPGARRQALHPLAARRPPGLAAGGHRRPQAGLGVLLALPHGRRAHRRRHRQPRHRRPRRPEPDAQRLHRHVRHDDPDPADRHLRRRHLQRDREAREPPPRPHRRRRSVSIASERHAGDGPPGVRSLRVPARVDDALRALLVLAAAPEAVPVKLTEVSDAEDLSPRFLSTVLVALRDHGLVHSHRGAMGGYWLARPAERDHAWPTSTTPSTPARRSRCPAPRSPCDLWQQLETELRARLASVTVADLAAGKAF